MAGGTADARRIWSHTIWRLRKLRRWSQDRLALELQRTSMRIGYGLPPNRGHITRTIQCWEAAERVPSDDYCVVLVAVFALEDEIRDGCLRPGSELDQLMTALGEMGYDVARRRFLLSAAALALVGRDSFATWNTDGAARLGYVLGGAVQSAARLQPAPVDGQAPSGLAGVRVDAEAMNAFRTADRQVGGGHLYGTVVHYLRTEVAPRLFGGTLDDGGLLTFSAAAALTDMAGWMAHDADRNLLAHQHFQRALALASIGADCQLRVHILAGMSHLALHLGDPDEAMQLAGAGTAKLKEGPANPELAARLVALEARGRAARGESAACVRLLLQAEQILDAALPAERSTWISRFDEASLASEAARCMRQLGQLVPARREAERVVGLRSGDRTRSRAFGQLILAQVLIEERDLDEASAVGRDVLDGTRALGSFLVVRQLQRLRELLAADRSAPAVAEFLGYLDEELRRRMVLYRSFSADHPG
jgi:hypothetical protein